MGYHRPYVIEADDLSVGFEGKPVAQRVHRVQVTDDGRRLRALTMVDAFTRETLAIDVDQDIKGEQVAAAMARIAAVRGAPETIRVDNEASLS